MYLGKHYPPFDIATYLGSDPRYVEFTSQNISVKDYMGQEPVHNSYLSSAKKVLVPGDMPYGHLLPEVVGSIVYEIESSNDKKHFISSVSPESGHAKELGTSTLLEFVAKKVRALGHKFDFASNENVMTSALVNNFVVHCSNMPTTSHSLKKIRDLFLDGVEQSTPTEKVYLSRRKVSRSSTTNLRVSDESVLEDYVESLGFRVVYPEDFGSYEEQLELLVATKVLMSATSSSLASSMFMAPGATVVELSTSLLYQPREEPNNIIANYYEIARVFDLNFLAINNKGSASEIVSTIQAAPAIKGILSQ